MTNARWLEEQITGWPNASVHPHRFGGQEFRFGHAEVGHVHVNGTIDIPLPRPIRDALMSEGLAEEHRWIPSSGWASFHFRHESDLKHALKLLRLSYLRYALKTASDPREMLERESEALGLSSRIRSLLEQHMPSKAGSVTVDPLTA